MWLATMSSAAHSVPHSHHRVVHLRPESCVGHGRWRRTIHGVDPHLRLSRRFLGHLRARRDRRDRLAAHSEVACNPVRDLSNPRGSCLGANRAPANAAALGRVRAGCCEEYEGAGVRMGAPASKYHSSPIPSLSTRNYKHLAAVGTPCQFRGQPQFRWNVQAWEVGEVEVQMFSLEKEKKGPGGDGRHVCARWPRWQRRSGHCHALVSFPL
ncbi:hypothetical protein LXA43DRAFT_133890 [Ganoderma leucocontextum]|nr:hypothetical protein LXA43DRAFT_133890 [Ganoderma leucocontextum]